MVEGMYIITIIFDNCLFLVGQPEPIDFKERFGGHRRTAVCVVSEHLDYSMRQDRGCGST